MNTKKSIIIIAVLLTLLTAIHLDGATLGKLKVHVLDSKGNPVPDVAVTIQDSRVASVVYKLKTKKNGTAIQNGLKNHVFAVTLEKEGYQAVKKNVKIPAGLLQNEEFTMYTNKEALQKSIANDPRAQAVNAFNKAADLINNKQYTEALPLLKKVLELDDSIQQAHYYIGIVLFQEGKYNEALEPLNKVIELDPENAQAYRILAAVYEKLGKTAESQKYTKLAQDKGGKTAIDAYNEGVTAFNAGETEKALASFKSAIELDANMADAYYRLGLCYLNKGDNAQAIENLKKYIKLKPDGDEVETAKAIIEGL